MNVSQKVTSQHLKRGAYLYVRQSTLRQVMENTESTKRQYALRERAAALGWAPDQVVVIDSDLGQSGASAVDREGFQRLVADVGMGRVGIVLGLEVSRLARNCSDWHQLLEICGLTKTLILDEDGLYDPCHFNDRLLLGLKGTMSEAELHVLQARLQGGVINKATRGELRMTLPIGLTYGADDKVRLDPDTQVQNALRTFFQTFRQTRSAVATVKAFHEQGLKFPRRSRTGPSKGDLFWSDLNCGQALAILHNPRYTGAYCFGRKTREGRPQPREKWKVFIPDAHPGYLTWSQYESNERCLRENAAASLIENRNFPPREGPSLLQGLVFCGKCGRRMYVRYYSVRKGLFPSYCCHTVNRGYCDTIPGAKLDEAVARLLVEMVTPLALEAALAVQAELVAQRDRVDRLLRQQVERARYEADLARRRYMQVDPENRLVADTLEAEWNAGLRALNEAQGKYERDLEKEAVALSEGQRDAILGLATDFPRLWNLPTTRDQERKRFLRLLVEDVTLSRTTSINAQIRFKGGSTRTITLPIPLTAWKGRQTSAMAIQAIDRWLDEYHDHEVARLLNEHGFQSGMGKSFSGIIVKTLRDDYGLASYSERLESRGFLKWREVLDRLRIGDWALRDLLKEGRIKPRRVNNKGELRFDPDEVESLTAIPSSRAFLTSPEVVEAIDRWLDDFPEDVVAVLLNEHGLKSGTGKSFKVKMVRQLRQEYGLRSRRERLESRGFLSILRTKVDLKIGDRSLKRLVEEGRVKAHRVNKKGEYLFEPFEADCVRP